MKAWKKQMAAVLAVLILAGMAACGTGGGQNSGAASAGKSSKAPSSAAESGSSSAAASKKPAASKSKAESSASQAEQPTQSESSAAIDTEAENSTSVPDDMDGMTPLVQAHILALHDGMAYDVSDPLYFWWVMRYAMNLRGSNDPGSVELEDSLRMPRQAVQEFAAALFADYSELPEIPEELSGDILYDEDWDAYIFPLGGSGYYINLTDYRVHEDGTQTVTAVPGIGDPAGDTWNVELIANPWIDGIETPRFFYSITSVELM